MNPKEFGWTADQHITVRNPLERDFTFQVHSKTYTVAKGEVVKMPGFMAWVFTDKLSVLLAQENGDFENKWGDEEVRKQYYAKVVVRQDDLIQKIEPEEEPDPIERGLKDDVKADASGGEQPGDGGAPADQTSTSTEKPKAKASVAAK